MKAIVYTAYGPPDVLQLQEIPTPKPKANEVRIRIRAASVNFGDLLVRKLGQVTPAQFHMPALFLMLAKLYFGIFRPRRAILGSEFAGDIDTVGSAVTRFNPGTPVFGFVGPRMGAYAEYICMSENGILTEKPANLTYEQAAVVPYGAMMALKMIGRLDLRPGQKVLVNGASAGIGSLALQIAKHRGATVTGVCGTQRMEFVRALGADRVIDYAREDFTAGDERWDVIFDILGKGSFDKARRVLAPDGRYVYVSFKSKQLMQMLRTRLTGGPRALCASETEQLADLVAVKGLFESGALTTVIDRTFPLEQAADAHRYVESGTKAAQVAITVGAPMGSPLY
ncbi:MAG TPA: NAD(P)-dependent alcohol dehydrogenase [bacterium]|nr:NAD(P)-dependent alcohol dehydrogenase [bacterium]